MIPKHWNAQPRHPCSYHWPHNHTLRGNHHPNQSRQRWAHKYFPVDYEEHWNSPSILATWNPICLIKLFVTVFTQDNSQRYPTPPVQIVDAIAASNSSVFSTPPSAKIARVTWRPHRRNNNHNCIRIPNSEETIRQRLHIDGGGVALQIPAQDSHYIIGVVIIQRGGTEGYHNERYCHVFFLRRSKYL